MIPQLALFGIGPIELAIIGSVFVVAIVVLVVVVVLAIGRGRDQRDADS